MLKFLVFNTFFVLINSHFQSNSLCVGRNATSKPVIDYCTSHNGSLQSRCCFSSNSSHLLAIDLTEMSLNKVPALNEYMNLISVDVMDLRLNPELKSSEKDDFLGMQSLNSLFLPEQFPCPGGERVWKIITQTSDPSGIVCMYQRDLCTNSTNICIGSTSYCVLNGPDHFLCLCKNDYYGYKCLRHGLFPMGRFFAATITITIVLSTFFYLTQRRNVRKD